MPRQLLQGFRYALIGVKLAWAEEINFKIEIFCAALAIALGIFFHLSAIEFALIAFAVSSVLAAEAFNTALEELCDKFQPTRDPHIAKIKDLAAAAVLITSLGALIVGLFVFLPHL